jgi:hypothetical protein
MYSACYAAKDPIQQCSDISRRNLTRKRSAKYSVKELLRELAAKDLRATRNAVMPES